jgi:geranylgeranylglycerol-phosphate geranylgeranyltransferase
MLKFIKILSFFIFIIKINSFTNIRQHNSIQGLRLIKFYLKNFNNTNIYKFDKEINPIKENKLKKKVYNLFTLIRPKNIIPTIFLSFSGGWIINPSLNLFKSVPFIVSVIITILIMSASMVLNDIYDIEIDKINNPLRPLASGELQIKEAILFSIVLLAISEYLTFQFMPNNLKFIVQLVIVKIILYTPVLKKILFVKNVFCASIVSFSLFFSGLSISDTILSNNKNYGLLLITMSLIFFGSLTNEILLDILDTDGDKYNNITTISTTFGKENSFKVSSFIINFGILLNTLVMTYLCNNIIISLFISLILIPLLLNIKKIKINNLSNESIINYMKYSSYPLFGILIYFCIISYFSLF